MDRVYISSTILGAVVNIIINLLLIEKLGAIGVAVGTIFAEATVAIYQTVKVRKELEVIKFAKKSIFYFVPGLIMVIIIKIIEFKIGQSILTGIIQIVVGGIIYCSISLMYMISIKSDIVMGSIYKIKNWINV